MKMHQQGGVANGSGKLNAGIDVSKLHLDVCVGNTQQRVVNDANGWNELTAMLQAAPVDLVVMEATGGYERGLVCALQGAGVPTGVLVFWPTASRSSWARSVRPHTQCPCRFARSTIGTHRVIIVPRAYSKLQVPRHPSPL
jgi:hypothetical protein